MIGRWSGLTQSAALALRHGWDPLRYLGIEDPVERIAADAVLKRAEKTRVEELNDMLKQIEIAVANGIARAFSKS